MKKICAAISVVAIAFLFASSFVIANPTTIKECVPFAAKEVPDEIQKEWKFYTSKNVSHTDPDGKKVVWETSRYYRNQDKTGLNLGVHSYFGQVAMKAWACRSSGEDPVTKDTPDHMVAILKDGKWYSANVQHPEIKKVLAADGKLAAVTLILRDKDGKIVVERTINRLQASSTKGKATNAVLDVEMWELILGSCEKVVFNDDFQSGLKRCYYLDPTHKYGVGAITEVFYKDGSTHLYWKGWALHTDKAQTAHLLDNGKWYVTLPSKMPCAMGYLTAMRAFYEKAKSVVDGKLTLEKLTSYVTGKDGKPMMDKTSTVYFNKNSANDPNPSK